MELGHGVTDTVECLYVALFSAASIACYQTILPLMMPMPGFLLHAINDTFVAL
jgi:hypothetical protein